MKKSIKAKSHSFRCSKCDKKFAKESDLIKEEKLIESEAELAEVMNIFFPSKFHSTHCKIISTVFMRISFNGKRVCWERVCHVSISLSFVCCRINAILQILHCRGTSDEIAGLANGVF